MAMTSFFVLSKNVILRDIPLITATNPTAITVIAIANSINVNQRFDIATEKVKPMIEATYYLMKKQVQFLCIYRNNHHVCWL